MPKKDNQRPSFRIQSIVVCLKLKRRHFIIFLLFFFQDSAADRARKIFGELDVDGDGELTTEEFVRGCMDDPELVRLLNAGGIESDDDDGD